MYFYYIPQDNGFVRYAKRYDFGRTKQCKSFPQARARRESARMQCLKKPIVSFSSDGFPLPWYVFHQAVYIVRQNIFCYNMDFIQNKQFRLSGPFRESV